MKKNAVQLSILNLGKVKILVNAERKIKYKIWWVLKVGGGGMEVIVCVQ